VIEECGKRGKGTEFIEIATKFKCIDLVHRAFDSDRDMTFSNSTTNISKSRDTVGHKTSPSRIL